MQKKGKELFIHLKEVFMEMIEENNLGLETIEIKAKALKPEEAIGQTQRKDFPILVGKEVMLEASFKNAKGQAFTHAPCFYEGTIGDIMKMDLIEDDYAKAIFIAALNAVTCYLGIANHTIHCKNNEPEQCGEKILQHFREHFKGKKIALIGYQPAILEHLSKEFEIVVLDLNPDNVGQIRYGCRVMDGEKDFERIVKDWCDVILCTGSTLCNGTITNFLEVDKRVIFFGTTLAGAAAILGCERFCPCSR